MVYRTGDKVIVDGEECEIVSVYGAGAKYRIKTPSGEMEGINPEQIGTEPVEEEEEEKEEEEENKPRSS